MLARFTRCSLPVAVAWLWLWTIASALVARATEAQPAVESFPNADLYSSWSPLEIRLLLDTADGHWNEHSLVEAAEIASGTETEDDLNAAVEQFAALAAEMRSALPPSENAEDTAAAVLAFLHRRVLWGGYDLQATELSYVLATGRYNCVSATVLFNCLARDAGLNVEALRLPHHTRSVLVDGDKRISIEATCADWFKSRERFQPLNSATDASFGAASTDLESQEPGEPITDVALVAMIYYNRGVEALRRHEYGEAIRLNRLALSHDSANFDARGNLLAAINKRALELTADRQFSAAIALIDTGLAISADHRPLRENRTLIDRRRRHSMYPGATSPPD